MNVQERSRADAAHAERLGDPHSEAEDVMDALRKLVQPVKKG
jgi:hypothetical protein